MLKRHKLTTTAVGSLVELMPILCVIGALVFTDANIKEIALIRQIVSQAIDPFARLERITFEIKKNAFKLDWRWMLK